MYTSSSRGLTSASCRMPTSWRLVVRVNCTVLLRLSLPFSFLSRMQVAGSGPVNLTLFERFESCSQKVARCLPPIIDPEEWKGSAEHVSSSSILLAFQRKREGKHGSSLLSSPSPVLQDCGGKDQKAHTCLTWNLNTAAGYPSEHAEKTSRKSGSHIHRHGPSSGGGSPRAFMSRWRMRCCGARGGPRLRPLSHLKM